MTGYMRYLILCLIPMLLVATEPDKLTKAQALVADLSRQIEIKQALIGEIIDSDIRDSAEARRLIADIQGKVDALTQQLESSRSMVAVIAQTEKPKEPAKQPEQKQDPQPVLSALDQAVIDYRAAYDEHMANVKRMQDRYDQILALYGAECQAFLQKVNTESISLGLVKDVPASLQESYANNIRAVNEWLDLVAANTKPPEMLMSRYNALEDEQKALLKEQRGIDKEDAPKRVQLPLVTR